MSTVKVHLCQQARSTYDGECFDHARYYVASIHRPASGDYTCTQHLAKAVDRVAKRSGPFAVTVVKVERATDPEQVTT